jgi:hypothetical protein
VLWIVKGTGLRFIGGGAETASLEESCLEPWGLFSRSSSALIEEEPRPPASVGWIHSVLSDGAVTSHGHLASIITIIIIIIEFPSHSFK